MCNLAMGIRSALYGMAVGLCVWACTSRPSQPEVVDREEVVQVPVFNADSAYAQVARQVGFGPRIPNTEAHRRVADYIAAQCNQYGAATTVQRFSARSYDGQLLSLSNIIASYEPEKPKRILLAAHWDTRPFADKDSLAPQAPFDGANDGASGVGVLLEVARLLGQGPPPPVGVDLIFFDGEDFGEPQGTSVAAPPTEQGSWWCLGSQYWSNNKHKPNYSAYYGILLDMVGGKGAQFAQEGVSVRYAPRIVKKVWDAAAILGYSGYFVPVRSSEILDDHVYVNQWGKIPMIDIVQYDPDAGYFGPNHHTQGDNMDAISKETLEAVGRTLLYVVYHEKG